MAKVYQYVLDFKAKTDKFSKDVGGVKGMLKGAAVAAGAMFAVDKIMDAGAAVADYAVEISGVSAEISKLTGLQGAALDQATGYAKALSSSYDQDISEGIKASNVMMKTFGDSASETFNVLNKGFATTANSNGDFLKQVQEYSTHFDEAGLSASEMTAIIAEGNKMGVFDDKSADAIKEGSIRLREMTKSTKDALGAIGLSSTQIQKDISSGNKSMFDVMQLVSTQLKTLPQQSPAVGAALADIFGGPGEDGIQFIRTLADVNTNLDSVVGQAGEAAAAQVAWSEELAEFHTIGAQVFGGTGRMMTQVKTTMMSWLNVGLKGLVDMANYFIDLYNESMVFRGAIQYIKMSFENVWEAIKLGFNQVLNVFKTAGEVIAAIFTGNFSEIPGLLKGAFEESAADAKSFGQNVAGNFMNAYENTLTPKKKIELISLSSDQAVAAGAKVGKDFAKGVQANIVTKTVDPIDFKAYLPPDEELEYNPFDSKTMEGQATMLSAVSGEVSQAFAKMDESAKIWGKSVDTVAEKKNFLKSQISDLVENGYTAESSAVQYLTEQYNQLGSQTTMMENFGNVTSNALSTIGSALGMANDGWGAFFINLLQQIPIAITQIAALTGSQLASSTAIVAGKSSEAMASAAASGAKMPFPANIGAMFAAIAAVTSVFATIPAIPKLASGAVVSGRNTVEVGEYPGAAHNPELIAPADKMMGFIRKAVGEAGGSGIGGTVRIVFANGSLEGYMDHRSRKTKNFG